jgi:uncharacterized protein (TIGR02186 family)
MSRPITCRIALLLAAFVILAFPRLGQAQGLSADLSSHLIAITTGFTGTELTLFGAVEGGGDVAVVIEGPTADLVVRRKEQIAGIWTNASSVRFTDAPTFYYAAATRAPSQFMRQDRREVNRVGLDNLNFTVRGKPDAQEMAEFRTALIANRQASGLYASQIGNVTFIGNQLFRSDIYFPSNVPTGNYTVKVMLVRGGEVVAQTDTPLAVRKIGDSADIYNFAHDQSGAYGILAILFAASAGWFAAFMFRKR